MDYLPGLSLNLFSVTTAIDNGFKLENDARVIILTHKKLTLNFNQIQETAKGYHAGIYLYPCKENVFSHLPQ